MMCRMAREAGGIEVDTPPSYGMMCRMALLAQTACYCVICDWQTYWAESYMYVIIVLLYLVDKVWHLVIIVIVTVNIRNVEVAASTAATKRTSSTHATH